MKQEVGFFESFDHTKLFYRFWLSEKANSKACLIIHGFGEHSGRYGELANFFSGSQYSFFAFDLRGQGRSDGRRVYAERFDDFILDIEAYVSFLKSRKLLSGKFAILGHSLGGLIALQTVKHLGEQVDKIALSSPFLGAHGLAALGLTFWIAAALDCMMPKIGLPGPAKPKYLFHDQQEMAQYLADTLIERRVTVHLAKLMLEESRAIAPQIVELKVPLLVMASGDDRIVSFAATRNWFEKVLAPKKELKTYPDFYHEIFHETGKEAPMRKLKQFLDE